MLHWRGTGRSKKETPPLGACLLLPFTDNALLIEAQPKRCQPHQSAKAKLIRTERERKSFPSDTNVTIHDYKLLELSNTSMIGSERYAEAMKIAPGQQRFRGAFTEKPSME
jgi:hypothetical protein